jgi:hypothetical protein
MSLTKPSREDLFPTGQASPPTAAPAPSTENGETEIFLSWGGAIYGPARAEEVVTGLRTSWFDDDALFWFEGQPEWRPVDQFPGLQGGGHQTLAGRRVGSPPDGAPPLPPDGSRPGRSAARSTRRAGHRSGKSGSPRRRGGRGRSQKTARGLIFGVVLLAVAATVALLFLLMRF